MVFPVFLKLFSESLLSFYPAMVKYIQFPVINQMWARLVVYALISALFMNWGTVWKEMFSWFGVLFAGVTALHIYSSYVGFSRLEAGVSYSIFYVYPLLIMLFGGGGWRWIYLAPLLGVGLLTWSTEESKKSSLNTGKTELLIGMAGILVSTLTEVASYFIVKKMHSEGNKWNVLFIGYLIPAIVLSVVLNKNAIPFGGEEKWKAGGEGKWWKSVALLLVGNALIGAVGYYLRFFTIDKLSTLVYSSLSYFGIVMAYVYGWALNKDKITWEKACGSLIIIISGILMNFVKF